MGVKSQNYETQDVKKMSYEHMLTDSEETEEGFRCESVRTTIGGH